MSNLRKFIPEFIYGSVDGTVTTFAIVAASIGAGLPSGITLVLGIANLVADGFSMGASSFLSAQSDASKKSSRKDSGLVGVSTFTAFLLAGTAPLLVYLYDVFLGNAAKFNSDLFYISMAMTFTTFALIGYFKSRVEKRSAIVSIAQTVGLGAIAASLAYFAGDWLASLLGVAL